MKKSTFPQKAGLAVLAVAFIGVNALRALLSGRAILKKPRK